MRGLKSLYTYIWKNGDASHPSWVRGLKLLAGRHGVFFHNVAPFMGAWIEIMSSIKTTRKSRVAPFMGAWIEIANFRGNTAPPKVAPFMGAWIEMCCSPFDIRQ